MEPDQQECHDRSSITLFTAVHRPFDDCVHSIHPRDTSVDPPCQPEKQENASKHHHSLVIPKQRNYQRCERQPEVCGQRDTSSSMRLISLKCLRRFRTTSIAQNTESRRGTIMPRVDMATPSRSDLYGSARAGLTTQEGLPEGETSNTILRLFGFIKIEKSNVGPPGRERAERHC